MTDVDRLAEAPLDLPRVLQALDSRRVEYVLIGGIAGAAHGSTSVTDDVDICYQRSTPNVRALARALRDLQAVLHDGARVLAHQVEPRSLQIGNFFLFWTTAGKLDCLAVPDGTGGFEDLVRSAISVEYGDVTVRVTSLDDLIRMKRASGRAKDRAELEILGALREEILGTGGLTGDRSSTTGEPGS